MNTISEVPFQPRQLQERLRSLQRENRQLRRLCTHDPLTGLLNRRGLEHVVEREWKRAIRRQTPIAFLITDIDYFKRFNDAAGHLVGDKCLIKVAQRLQDATRRSGDVAARYGGEEFAIVLPEVTLAGSKIVVERIHRLIAAARIAHPSSPLGPFLTLSTGVAWSLPQLNDDWRALLASADNALYRAKETGRDQFCLSFLKRPGSAPVALKMAS